jgi:hypothetical protein
MTMQTWAGQSWDLLGNERENYCNVVHPLSALIVIATEKSVEYRYKTNLGGKPEPGDAASIIKNQILGDIASFCLSHCTRESYIAYIYVLDILVKWCYWETCGDHGDVLQKRLRIKRML